MINRSFDVTVIDPHMRTTSLGATVLTAAGVAQALAPTAVPLRIDGAAHRAAGVQGLSMVASAIPLNPHGPTRRAVLRRAAELAVCYGAAFGGAWRAVAESDAAGRRVVPEDDMEFHMQWSYAKPQDILPYIYATARRGQVDEILKAMDEFGRYPCLWQSPTDHRGGHEQPAACLHARTYSEFRSAARNWQALPHVQAGRRKGRNPREGNRKDGRSAQECA